MLRSVTAAEIVALFGVPPATVYRLASTEQWRRVGDGRRPALYDAEDVAATFQRLGPRAA